MNGSGFHLELLRPSEWICVVYFAWLALLSLFVRVPPLRRWGLIAASTIVIGTLFLLPVAAEFDPSPYVDVARDWLPALLILLGYRESGHLTFPRQDQSFEKAFLRWDDYLFRTPIVRFVGEHFPTWLDALFEFSYLQCYAIVPSGIAVLYLAHQRAFVDRYWSVVLPAVFAAYGLTPLFPAQPPRKLPQVLLSVRRPSSLRRLNLWIHDHASIKVNTFPSGHVAAGVSTSLALMRPLPLVGACYMVVAVGIALGSVRGRYHYSADALLGALLAVAACLSVKLV